MMKIKTTSAGSYPRIGEEAKDQILRRTIALWEQKKKTIEDLKSAEEKMTQEALDAQAAAGLDLVTDGQICWYDPISHMMSRIEGVRINGLLRFFDTNSYFRQPVVEGELKRTRPLLTEEYQFARNHSKIPVKVVLTGPTTLAQLSVIKTGVYTDVKSLALKLAQILNEEMKSLFAKGARTFQVDEPSLLNDHKEFHFFKELSPILMDGLKEAEIGLHTYFGDALPLYDKLQELPFDYLGLDFTYSPFLADHIAKNGSKKKLALGLLDGRNTKLESEKEIVTLLSKITPKLSGEEVYLQSSCGLEYLPRNRASDKLRLLTKIKQKWTKKLS